MPKSAKPRKKRRILPMFSGQRRPGIDEAMVVFDPLFRLFEQLETGYLDDAAGRPIMREWNGEWCEIAPAIEGWRDCWQRLAPDISTYYLGVLASRLRDDKPLTPRLVEQAREEFDATVQRIADIEPGRITSAIRTTEIAWEVEKLQRSEA